MIFLSSSFFGCINLFFVFFLLFGFHCVLLNTSHRLYNTTFIDNNCNLMEVFDKELVLKLVAVIW